MQVVNHDKLKFDNVGQYSACFLITSNLIDYIIIKEKQLCEPKVQMIRMISFQVLIFEKTL